MLGKVISGAHLVTALTYTYLCNNIVYYSGGVSKEEWAYAQLSLPPWAHGQRPIAFPQAWGRGTGGQGHYRGPLPHRRSKISN